MKCFVFYLSEAGVQNPNPRKRKKQSLKMGHGGTLDSSASGVLGKQGVGFHQVLIHVRLLSFLPGPGCSEDVTGKLRLATRGAPFYTMCHLCGAGGLDRKLGWKDGGDYASKGASMYIRGGYGYWFKKCTFA